jgi:hypothetical protein
LFADELALLFSLDNLLSEEGMASIGKDFKDELRDFIAEVAKKVRQLAEARIYRGLLSLFFILYNTE